jgi:hypothetical protein
MFWYACNCKWGNNSPITKHPSKQPHPVWLNMGSPHFQMIPTTWHIRSDNLPHCRVLRVVHLYDTHSILLTTLTSPAPLHRVNSTGGNNSPSLFLFHNTGSACTPSWEDDVVTGSGQSPLVAFCDDAMTSSIRNNRDISDQLKNW